MSGPEIVDQVFEAGQNEGIDRTLLPLPQLSYVQNARMRKTGRWGKRNGTTGMPTTNTSSTPLGSGTGAVVCVGPGFAVVDDQCAVYDQVRSKWVDPASLVAVNTTALNNPRVPGAISGWVPSNSYFTVPPLDPGGQTSAGVSCAVFLGYLWTVQVMTDPKVGFTVHGSMFRISAVNPADQSLAFVADIRATTGANGTYLPQLVANASRLVVVYASVNTTTGNGSIVARSLTTIAGGFSAESTLQTGFTDTQTVNAALWPVGFDVCANDANTFLLVTSLLSTASVKLFLFSGFTNTASQTLTPAEPQLVSASVAVDSANGRVYVSYASFNITGPVSAAKTAIYTANIAGFVGTATLSVTASVSFPQPNAAPIPGGGARVIFDATSVTPSGLSFFRFVDVTSAGGVVGNAILTQYRYAPISKPFTVGTQVYVWVSNFEVVQSGYPTLLRLPKQTEYGAVLPSGNQSISCPVEMAPQDFLYNPGLDFSRQLILSQFAMPLPCFTGSVWAFPHSARTTAPASTYFGLGNYGPSEVRVLAATHFTTLAAARSRLSVTADESQLLPGGMLARVDSRGCTESGFATCPFLTASGAAGGGLTPSTTYKYVAVYRARNAAGRFELSQVSPVASVALGGAQGTANLSIYALSVGARQSVVVDIYGTESNGSVFYLIGTISANPTAAGTLSYSDAVGGNPANQAVYTQVGQQLSNFPPPPCRFAVVGGQRVWLSGLFRPDVVHCSKLIQGDESPSWADNDAFRIVSPEPVTGIAWMDNFVIFGANGIYVVSGDGPTDDGIGEFSAPVRMPYAIGCIEPRSVITIDEGTFFQTSRGLYMLPRGLGSPVPVGDAVLDTLAAFPIITGAVAYMGTKEQTVCWSCSADAVGTTGAHIVFDVTHKAWSVDIFNQANSTAHMAIGNWLNGGLIYSDGAGFTQPVSGLFADDFSAFPVQMILRTGDIRLFGMSTHGVVSGLQLLAQLQSACTLNVTRTSDLGASSAPRVFSGAAPDPVGALTYTQVEFGSAELRDITSLRLQFDESSTSEGLAFLGMAINHLAPQGPKPVKPADRVT